MLDVLGMVAALDRPRLLVTAARFGVDEYNRAAQLPRLIGRAAPARAGEAIMRLLDLEAAVERKRAADAGDYSVARHVALLIALLGEARHLRAAQGAAREAARGALLT